MSLPGMVIVKEELSKLDADVVASFLQSEGIEAIVNADDAAGNLPSLDETRFAQVLVPEKDAERARALIAEHPGTGAEDGEDDDDLDDEEDEADEADDEDD